jgi:hypothetical protein
MPDFDEFESNPRNYAFSLAEEGLVTWEHLATMALKAMSWADCAEMCDNNELSPRFFEDE